MDESCDSMFRMVNWVDQWIAVDLYFLVTGSMIFLEKNNRYCIVGGDFLDNFTLSAEILVVLGLQHLVEG